MLPPINLLEGIRTLYRKYKMFERTVNNQKTTTTRKVRIIEQTRETETFIKYETVDQDPTNERRTKMRTVTKIRIETNEYKFEFEQSTSLDLREEMKSQQPKDQLRSSDQWDKYLKLRCWFFWGQLISLISRLFGWISDKF